MKKILAPIIFLVFSSFNATVIESDSANYDGKTMYLKGSVLLKHEKGSITADNATIVKEDQKKGFSSIHVEDHVVFNPSFGGELTADLLDMKAEEKIAYLKALNPSSWVTYRGDFSGQPLIFKSSSLLFDFSDDNKQKVFSGIKKIEALGPVKTTYAKHFKLFSDKAIYKDSEGLLTYFCEETTQNCTIIYEDKGTIKASKVILDPQKHILKAIDPDGVFKSKFYEDILFEAKSLSFDEEGRQLKLSKDVSIYSMGFTCLNNDEVLFVLDPEHATPCKTLKCEGKTFLFDDKGVNLTCNGSILMQRDEKKLYLQGKETPVLFESPLGKIRANKITIDYDLIDNKTEFTKIFFEGKVACLNDVGLFKEENESVKRYALADFVTYLPNKKELTLKSHKPSKVLFYDETKKTKFSAEQIVIDLPDQDHKERIKTSGNVRMVFSEKEDAEFKKFFIFEE